MGARRVLVTGAEGTIGTAVREHLAGRFELVSLTLTPQDFPSHVADIAELDAIRPAFENVDGVVHLAGSASLEAGWDDVLRNNIVGTYNVFEAARQPESHASSTRPRITSSACTRSKERPSLYDPDDERSFDQTTEIRPDSLYGVSKSYGEALGRLYMEQHGLRVFCLRIGAVRAHDDPNASTGNALIELDAEAQRNRLRAVWLSRRDCAELIARCLEVEDVSWAIVYGVSGIHAGSGI